ncbi:hypothetical protein KG088_16050 [Halomonas sp. TRM85114]|uniref:hypothetical protein n=1 Tax=Halomonas jincaotanensis TaxID=2810616 RepID=UPI001BD49F5C|nr:hypothetical protein [Halomonas jincaotanensis]MBS9405136.1 hypothetical protein [Halomonas jincaotanensis]
MFDWLVAHKELVTILTNIGTLLIWLVYAQLLYFGFRRQRRPRLIINRGKKKDINARCIISNMSAEPIYIQHIIAELNTTHGKLAKDVTDWEERPDEEGRTSERQTSRDDTTSDGTRQGPLKSGSYLYITSFNDLVQSVAAENDIALEDGRPVGDLAFVSLTIRLICIYGSEDQPIGAERCFYLEDDKRPYSLVPSNWDTRRLASIWQRRKLRKLVKRLNSSNFPHRY